MIRYLGADERQKIRELYERTFQDSVGFVDYYFGEYVKHGTRCVVDEEEGDILSMISIHEKQWYHRDKAGNYALQPVWYLYGVATVPEERRKGKMQALLERIMEDAKREAVWCLYLIPVNPDIYEKAGFRLVRLKQEVQVEVENCSNMTIASKKVKKCGDSADFVVQKLDVQDVDALDSCYEQYYKQQEVDAFLVKDAEYFREYMTQLAIDGGVLYGMFGNGRLIGYIAGSVEDDAFSAIEYVDLECGGFEFIAPFLGRQLGVSSVKLSEHPVMIYELVTGNSVMSTNETVESEGNAVSEGSGFDRLECIGCMDEV